MPNPWTNNDRAAGSRLTDLARPCAPLATGQTRIDP
jgi:hypothetical protein